MPGPHADLDKIKDPQPRNSLHLSSSVAVPILAGSPLAARFASPNLIVNPPGRGKLAQGLEGWDGDKVGGLEVGWGL